MIRRTVPRQTGDPPSPRSFHATTVIESAIYVHGGLDNSNRTLSGLYKYDVTLMKWSKIETTSHPRSTSGANANDTRRDSLPFKVEGVCSEPSLSHHCAVSINKRYTILIGGWNGRQRTSEVFIFDTVNCLWYKAKTSGDIPVGLSSHTADFVSDNEVLVIGREGGVHTQRRAGDSFLLNVNTGVYKSQAYNIDSRSGHTADMIRYGAEKCFRLFIYSGRKTGIQWSTVGKWNTKNSDGYNCEAKFAQQLVSFVKSFSSIGTPEGRQNCKSLCINDQIVLIYGGELWKARDWVTSDIIAFDCADCTWHKIPTADSVPKLTGFSFDVGIDGKCYVFGGNNRITSNNQIWHLEFSSV